MLLRKLGLLLLALNLSTNTFAEPQYEDEYIQALLDSPAQTLETLQITAKNYKKNTGFVFDPDELNLIGSLARAEYERQIALKPVTREDLSQFLEPNGGHVETKDLIIAHRY